jgi:predicted GIY-YIG superfamily endonuclease
MAWVYILRCADDSLYVGHTHNLVDRERTHNEGRGGSYTAKRGPVRVVYSEYVPSLDCARRRERQLKRWSGEKKEALVAGNLRELKRLSRSHKLRRPSTSGR